MRTGLVLLAFVLLGSPLAAHDFWLLPSSFRPSPGEKVAVRIRVGDQFPGDPVPRMPHRIERFALVGAAKEEVVPGVEGTDPAGFLLAPSPGRYLVVYDSNDASIRLEGEKFERHLSEQGLEAVSELRRKRGQTADPALELYSRCAKALIAVGKGPAKGYDRALGLPLELIPEKDPYATATGDELPVRLLFQGKPLAGARYEARSPGRPEPVSGRTDRDGRFRVRFPAGSAGGVWLIKAVHMVEAPAGSGGDWKSFWASLTFELPQQPVR